MTSLPGNLDVYGSVPILNFDSWKPVLAPTPPNAKLQAWEALRETERRWVHFDWATYVLSPPHANNTLFADLAAAYLFSFEATLQRLASERKIVGVRKWISAHTANDVISRGLRTLRHTRAHHLQPAAIGIQRPASAESQFAGIDRGGGLAWRWTDLAASDLAGFSAANPSPLAVGDLPEFNRLSEELLVLGLMRHGVGALGNILEQEGP